ncbi:MAG TPA: porin [Roseiarcus sp.]|nr:porin [Roseiarcus sp.]
MMNVMKSMLLGSAVGVAAASGAPAADLPTRKAAPAEYVKICNVGGMAGFILPGSDTCFKIAGYVTGQIEAGNLKQSSDWAFAPGLAATFPGASTFTRDSFGWTTRAEVEFDARQDTGYGVLRAYAELQFENGNGFDNTGTAAYINRAYVQWAGVTAGKANSFFAFFGGGEAWANIFSPDQQGFNQPDLLAYTATFGGGFSATISAQSSGSNGFSGGGTNMVAAGNATYGGMQAPDVVAALRVDQGWGAAQVSGVAHQVRAYDGQDASGFATPTSGLNGNTINKWGWGVLGGVKFNLPSFGPGDNFQAQGVWTQNAIWYSGIPNGMWGENGQVNGNGLPMVVADTWSNGDGSWATPTAWSVAVTFEHHFSPQFMIAPEFSYAQLHWSGFSPGAAVIPANAYSWIVGGAAHWAPVPHLDFEAELLYQTTHQSTPVDYAGGVTPFPDSADGFAGRLQVTRDF